MNSTSTPPLNSTTPPKPVTAADVAMKFAQDGPLYAIVAVALVLAMRGTATATEAIWAGLAGLLARSWPQAVQVAGKVGSHLLPIAAAGLTFGAVHACSPPPHVTYGGELAACTAAAKARQTQGVTTRDQACKESIQCENAVRARQAPPRPPRTEALDCK